MLFSNTGIDFVSAEFDLYLPDGIQITESADNQLDIYAGSRLTDHQIITRKNDDGSIKVAIYSLTNAVFAQQEGDILILKLRAAEDVEEGLAMLEINNQVLASADIQPKKAGDHMSIVKFTLETGINDIKEGNNAETLYDLQGRRSNAKHHGVYIVNGKKVIK